MIATNAAFYAITLQPYKKIHQFPPDGLNPAIGISERQGWSFLI